MNAFNRNACDAVRDAAVVIGHVRSRTGSLVGPERIWLASLVVPLLTAGQ